MVDTPRTTQNGRGWVHPNAMCETDEIGRGTRIWPFAHVCSSVTIGEDCNICEGVFIENDVTVGNRVTIKNGVYLWSGLEVDDDVFIGPNATFCNDRKPRSRAWKVPESTVLRKGSSVGANATVLPGVEIGAGALVGAGAVVTEDVPPYCRVVGNPARGVGFEAPEIDLSQEESSVDTAGIKLVPRSVHNDRRGKLQAIEVATEFPFVVQRYFVISGLRAGVPRGVHAHRETQQVVYVLTGAMLVLISNVDHHLSVRLGPASPGVVIERNTWSTILPLVDDSSALVLASTPYDQDDYVTSHEEFISLQAVSPE